MINLMEKENSSFSREIIMKDILTKGYWNDSLCTI